MVDFRVRLRALTESARISIAVAALLDLTLPWWDHSGTTSTTTSTGWGALGSSSEGTGWFLIIAVTASTATVLANRRGLHIMSATVCGLCGIALLISSAASQHSLQFR